MKTVEFQSVRSPAHHVRTTGHKFVGGSLFVEEAAAPAIRAYAAKYPQFGIREIRTAAPAPATTPTLSRRPSRPAKPAAAPISTPPDPVAPGASDEVSVVPPAEPTFAAAADGGFVTGPTIAVLGDAGDELVVPAPPAPELEAAE